jgi:site-specific DNA-methyltransferase (adenine-specific)
METGSQYLEINKIYHGDSRELMLRIRPESIACSIWSPPYYVGKDYEQGMTFAEWTDLLSKVIENHVPTLKKGGFMVINIADILCFKDDSMPKIQLPNPNKHKFKLTKEEILEVKTKHPTWNRYKLAEYFGCSEQTIDRRLNGNNIRGGKYNTQTKVFLTGGLIESMAYNAGLYLYDRRIWVKDPAWENSKWHSLSYRSIDEFEYLYFFWKPGETKVDRNRLARDEWRDWGSRGVWEIRSVRANDKHEAMFPTELPRRIIRLLTDENEIVLDPFMGSGSTAVAAIEEGRNYLGIEKIERYVTLARQRCQMKLPYINRSKQSPVRVA